jgi:hypothetical protein
LRSRVNLLGKRLRESVDIINLYLISAEDWHHFEQASEKDELIFRLFVQLLAVLSCEKHKRREDVLVYFQYLFDATVQEYCSHERLKDIAKNFRRLKQFNLSPVDQKVAAE